MRYTFPSAAEAEGSIVAIGGNLSPGMLLSAYEQGIFPWYNADEPIIWQSPDPRFVIFPEKLHVPASMHRVFNQQRFTISFDRDFPAVIKACSTVERPGQDGTWITDDIITGYTELYRLGYAHSAEAWQDGELVGGCYGLLIGKLFAGESMFCRVTSASKAAFLSLAQKLFADGVGLIDCQMHTQLLESMGGEEISRKRYLDVLPSLLPGVKPVPPGLVSSQSV
jgi:leucyl/phenylalanyl-tRNA--protein transferase